MISKAELLTPPESREILVLRNLELEIVTFHENVTFPEICQLKKTFLYFVFFLTKIRESNRKHICEDFKWNLEGNWAKTSVQKWFSNEKLHFYINFVLTKCTQIILLLVDTPCFCFISRLRTFQNVLKNTKKAKTIRFFSAYGRKFPDNYSR